MSPIPDDFEQLRRLLALKRHETPPPGYFHGFSRQVIVRIQAGELGEPEEASIWSFSGGSFLQRIWATLDARPVLAGAFGVAVCGFFTVGAFLSVTTAANNPLPAQAEVAHVASVVGQESQPEVEMSGLVSTPNYEPPKGGSLFEEFNKAQQRPRLIPAFQQTPAPSLERAAVQILTQP